MCQGHDLIHLVITLCKGRTKQIKGKIIIENVRQKETMLKIHRNIKFKLSRVIHLAAFGCYSPSHKGSAAGPAPQYGPPCSSGAAAAAHDSSYWDNTAY